MKWIGTVSVMLLALMLVCSSAVWSQYLTQDFEAAFTGSPAAPPGWTQSRVVLLGDGVPEGTGVDGEKDWEQNTNTGAGTWSKNPSSSSPIKPNAAVSGTGVLYMQDYNFGSTTSGGFGSRRLESPIINLAAASVTSPYVRFWYFYAATAGNNCVRVVASSNGGTTWNSIMVLTSNAGIVGTMTSATPWQRINVQVPAAYRTASSKVGIEMTNIWGTQDIFIDDFSVEEFTPTTIFSAATGNWSAPATWSGGVVPTSDNHVQVQAGHVVTIDVNTARCQQLNIVGTVNFASTGGALQVDNLLIAGTGTYNAFNATTGKPTFLGRTFQNDGIADFSVGTPTIWFTGGETGFIQGSGTYTNSRIVAVNFANAHGFAVSVPITITGAVGLIDGAVLPQGLLTLGNPAVTTTQTISVGRGSFATAPTFAAGMASRSVTYTQFFAQPATPTTITPGEEIESISGVRTVTGTLTIATFNNISLGYPLSVGNVAGTTGTLTLTRGILITSPTNLLTLNTFVTGGTGTTPSALTPPTTHGSYVVGPMRTNFPATGTTSRNFALGVGTNFNGPTPSSNVKKTATLANTAAWASQTITASLENPPSGSPTPPLTGVFGVKTLRLNLNGGPDLPATATLTWVGRNNTGGNSDNMLGAIGDLVIAQSAQTPEAHDGGPVWTQRSAASGSGAFVNNTDYTRTTATAAPGPIGPLATNGEYFALGTIAAGQAYDSSRVTQDVVTGVFSGGQNQQVIGIKIDATGSLAPLTATQFDLNTTGTTTVGDIDSAKIYYTGTTATFSTTTRFGTAVANPSGSFSITGSQALTAGSNYFWLAYDIDPQAATGNVLDAECTSVTIGGTPRTPSVTAPAGSRAITNTNFGGPTAGYYYANSLAISAPSRPTYGWIDPVAGGHTLIADLDWAIDGDDGFLPGKYIGFPFTFFGVSYDSVFIGTNGWLCFTNPSALTTAQLRGFTTIPTAGGLENYVAAAWKDLDCRTGTYPNAKVYFSADANRFVATFMQVHTFNSTPDSITFQIILYPNHNIKIQYNDALSANPSPISNASTTGIEDATGANGIQYRYNGAGGPMFGSPLALEFGTNQSALPIQLASFAARANQGGGVRLDWRTLTETNNFGFYVERRLSTEPMFTVVPNSFVPGSGTTLEPRDYLFVDNTAVQPNTYLYRLRQHDLDGTVHYTEPITFTYGLTSVNESAPREFALFQNYPNPFNPETVVKFSVENTGRATLDVYNVLGQKVATLFDEVAEAGQYYRVRISATNLATGLYVYRLQSGIRTDVKKMLLLK